METNDKEKEVVKKPDKYNTFQICNISKLTGVLREHMLKKYKGQSMTKTDWKKVFKKEKIDF